MRRLTFTSSTGSQLEALAFDTVPNLAAAERRILLVHGLASNARTWRGTALRLVENGASVVALNQRGHGGSEVTDSGYDFGTVTQDLACVLDELEWASAVVAGQSWGGNVAIDFAWRHPERCRTAIGIDGGAIRLSETFPTWEEAASALAPPHLDGFSATDIVAHLRSAHPDWAEDGIADTMENFRLSPTGTVEPHLPRRAHMAILHALYEHDPKAVVGDTSVPLALLAARPGPTPASVAEWFPNTRFVDGDHDLHVQQPHVVASFIEEAAGWV